jgi:hypothetical protein
VVGVKWKVRLRPAFADYLEDAILIHVRALEQLRPEVRPFQHQSDCRQPAQYAGLLVEVVDGGQAESSVVWFEHGCDPEEAMPRVVIGESLPERVFAHRFVVDRLPGGVDEGSEDGKLDVADPRPVTDLDLLVDLDAACLDLVEARQDLEERPFDRAIEGDAHALTDLVALELPYQSANLGLVGNLRCATSW